MKKKFVLIFKPKWQLKPCIHTKIDTTFSEHYQVLLGKMIPNSAEFPSNFRQDVESCGFARAAQESLVIINTCG